ncbi:MAG: hypothetical protein OEV92_10665 [Nitrospinota bacterium]|nr:hypothetical protein [Nitrospinota bacterium]
MWDRLLLSSLLGAASIAPSTLATGPALEFNEQTALGLGGFLIITAALFLGSGFQAIRLNPEFWLLMAVGASASLLTLILATAGLVEGVYASYGAAALAIFLLGLTPDPLGKDGVRPVIVVMDIIIFLAAIGFAILALATGAENAAYIIFLGMMGYGAFLYLSERRQATGAPGRSTMAYIGLFLLALGILILARIMAISVDGAGAYLDPVL